MSLYERVSKRLGQFAGPNRLCWRCRLYFLSKPHREQTYEVHPSFLSLLKTTLRKSPHTDHIIDGLKLFVESRELSWGTTTELYTRNCPFCRFLFSIWVADSLTWKNYGEQYKERYEERLACSQYSYPSEILVETRLFRRTVNLQIDANGTQRTKRHGRLKLPESTEYTDTVSISSIQGWIQACQSTSNGHIDHSRCHNAIISLDQPLDLLFIDVSNRCLVHADASCRYVALSYVWGKSTQFLRTEKRNLSKLLRNGALSMDAGVPTLINDAIELVCAIGEKLLWVDSLCLVQDDWATKYAGIRQMHVIYSRAYLTIVAASAQSTNSPLPGLRPGTRSPMFSQPVGNKRLAKNYVLGWDYPDAEEAVYHSRAWTMQEFMLSSRCLIFTSDAVYFRCPSDFTSELDCEHSGNRRMNTALWKQNRRFRLFRDYEALKEKPLAFWSPPAFTGVSQRDFKPRTPLDYHHNNHPSPAFVVFTDLVESYSSRFLSFESDILSAFNALQSALTHQYAVEFAFGMPLSTLNMALLWIPATRNAMRRRTEDFLPNEKKRETLPSWSWAGWKTVVRWPEPFTGIDSCSREYEYEDLVELSRLSVVGQKVPEGDQIDLVESTFSAKSPILNLSLGSLCFAAESTKATSFAYRHRVTSGSLRLEILPLIHSKTGVYNELNTYTVWPYQSGEPHAICSWDSNDDGLGRGILWGMELQEMERDDSLEFVALSTFRAYKNPHGKLPQPWYHFNEGREPLKDFPFVNCLLVKWLGDTADRVGLAQIGWLAWQEAKPKMKTITLR